MKTKRDTRSEAAQAAVRIHQMKNERDFLEEFRFRLQMQIECLNSRLKLLNELIETEKSRV